MILEINTSEASTIDWGATGASEIVQNVHNLIRTLGYEVAYDRTLGIQPGLLDRTLPEAVALVTARIYALVSEREPRASVRNVEYVGVDVEGHLQFKVAIEI